VELSTGRGGQNCADTNGAKRGRGSEQGGKKRKIERATGGGGIRAFKNQLREFLKDVVGGLKGKGKQTRGASARRGEELRG